MPTLRFALGVTLEVCQPPSSSHPFAPHTFAPPAPSRHVPSRPVRTRQAHPLRATPATAATAGRKYGRPGAHAPASSAVDRMSFNGGGLATARTARATVPSPSSPQSRDRGAGDGALERRQQFGALPVDTSSTARSNAACVGLRGLREAALSLRTNCNGTEARDLVLGRGRLEVEQSADVAAHRTGSVIIFASNVGQTTLAAMPTGDMSHEAAPMREHPCRQLKQSLSRWRSTTPRASPPCCSRRAAGAGLLCAGARCRRRHDPSIHGRGRAGARRARGSRRCATSSPIWKKGGKAARPAQARARDRSRRSGARPRAVCQGCR